MSIISRFALLSLTLAACGEATEIPQAAVRDSAGIRIVENVGSASTQAIDWIADVAGRIEIGRVGVTEEEQFGRVIAAVRLADGRIVVADADRHSPQLSMFGADGTFLKLVGQAGEGPGDYRFIGNLFREGDNGFATWDYGLKRLTSFDAEGKPNEMRRIDRPPCSGGACAGFAPKGLFASGEVLGAVGKIRINPPEGIRADSAWLNVASTEGSLRVIDSMYSRTNWQKDFSDGSLMFNDEPFGASGTLAVMPNGYARSDGSSYEVRFLTPDGTLTRIVRLMREVPPMTAGIRDYLWRKEIGNEAPQFKERSDEIFAWLVWPEKVPAYDDLQVDDDGRVWARVFPDSATMAIWHVFDQAGRLVGTALIPAHLNVQQIGEDFVLALDKGEFDESIVAWYPLRKEQD